MNSIKIIGKFKLKNNLLVLVGESDLQISEIKNLQWYTEIEGSKKYEIRITGEYFFKNKSANMRARAFMTEDNSNIREYLSSIQGEFSLISVDLS